MKIDAAPIEISLPRFVNDCESMLIAYAAIEIARKSLEIEEKLQELLQVGRFFVLVRFL